MAIEFPRHPVPDTPIPLVRVPVPDFEGQQQMGQRIAATGMSLRNDALVAYDITLRREALMDRMAKEEARLDVQEKVQAFEQDWDRAAIAERERGTPLRDLEGRLTDQTQRLMEQYRARLKYPESAQMFQVEAGKKIAPKMLKFRSDALETIYAARIANDSVMLKQYAQQAVLGATPELRKEAYDLGMRQITTGINEGYYDKTSGPLQIKAFHTMIEEGEILRDWRDPFKKSQVALALAGGAYPNMDRTQQNALFEKLTGQDRAEENRRAAEAKAAREQAVSEIEKNITDAVSAQQWQVAKDWVRRGRDDMTGTEYQHWTKIITDAELKKEKVDSDPATRARLVIATRTADTAAAAQKVRGEVIAAMANGLLSTEHGDSMLGHLQSLKIAQSQRAEDKALAMQGHRYDATKRNIAESLRVSGPAANLIDQQAQQVLATALEDHDRNTPYLGRGNEESPQWWERNKAKYIGMVASAAQQRIAVLTKDLGVYQDERSLAAARGNFRSDADFYDKVRALRDREALLAERQRLQSLIPSTTPLPASGTGVAPAAPSGGKSFGYK